MPFPNLYRCNKVLVNQKKKCVCVCVCVIVCVRARACDNGQSPHLSDQKGEVLCKENTENVQLPGETLVVKTWVVARDEDGRWLLGDHGGEKAEEAMGIGCCLEEATV
jgi:hypothetical protein